MEPALAVSASVAAVSLTAVVVSLLPDVVGRTGFRVPRWPAAAVVAVLLSGVALRERPASAEVPPPVVRLARPPEVAPPPSDLQPASRYTVVAGDCLWRIASRVLTTAGGAEPNSAEIARFWPRIYEANRQIIGDDPDLILVGQVLLIPEV